jgi:type I restriction enzyme S subunit
MSESIPDSWVSCKFGDIVEIKNGYAFKSSEFKKSKELDSDVPLVRQSQLRGAIVDLSEAVYLDHSYLLECSNYIIEKGDIIIGMSGSIGKVCEYINDYPALQNQRTGKLKPLLTGELDPKFFGLFLSNVERMLSEYAKGMGVQNISAKDIENLSFNLPPFQEQHRIVTKIEALFSELDKGIESFKTAREQLKIYRQALLKHAFSGKLTEQWRAENPDKLETAETLLQRIQIERQQRYQHQLKDWETNGKQGSKPKVSKTLPPLTAEELAELPELPEGWAWVKLGQLTWSVKDGPHFSPKYSDSGIPFISGGNVRPEGVDFENTKFISQELHEELCKRCKPEINDILYTKGGTTGIARVNTYDKEFSVWVHVAVLKLIDSLRPFFLQHSLNSNFCYAQAQKYTHGVGNQDLGLTRMVNIVLAICPIDEQDEVIKIIEDKISICDQFDQSLITALQQAEALRLSILKKAFSGQLVLQDPNDEPASVLLERIQAEKAAQAAQSKPKKTPKRKANA